MTNLTKTLDVTSYSDEAILNMLTVGGLDAAKFKELMETHEATKVFKEKAEWAEFAINKIVQELEKSNYSPYGRLSPNEIAMGIRQIASSKGIKVSP